MEVKMISRQESEVEKTSKDGSMEDLFVGMEIVENSHEPHSSKSALSDIKDLNLDVVCKGTDESKDIISSQLSFLDDDDDQKDDPIVGTGSPSCQEEIIQQSRDNDTPLNHLKEHQPRYDAQLAKDSAIVESHNAKDYALGKIDIDDILNLENDTNLGISNSKGNSIEGNDIINKEFASQSKSKPQVNEELSQSTKNLESATNALHQLLEPDCDMKFPKSNIASFPQQSLTIYQYLSLQIERLKAKQEEIKQIFHSFNIKQSKLIQKWEVEYMSEESILEKIEGLKCKQNEFEDKENYDEAMEANRIIQELEERYENYRFQHPVSSESFVALDSEYLENCAIQYKKQEELIISLKSLYDQHSCSNICDEKFGSKEFEKDISEVKEKIAIVDRSLGHIKLDKEHLSKTEDVLQKEILKNTKDLEIEKENLLDKKQRVKNQISELKNQLAVLEEEESCYLLEIDGIQCKIDNIMSDYKPKVAKIETEKNAATKEENQLLFEMDNLRAREQELLLLSEEKENEVKRYKDLVKSLKHLIDQVTTQKNHPPALSLEQIVNMDYLKNNANEDYLRAKSTVKTTRSNFDIVSNNLFEKENRKRSIQRTVNDIETQLSELHKTKLLAVKEKNYQEAKRVSGEMNELRMEGESKQKLVDQLTDDIKKGKEEVSVLEFKLEEEKNVYEKIKLDQDQKLLQYLQKTVQDIRTYTDSHPDVWVSNILQLEVKQCLNIMKKIKEKKKMGNEYELNECSESLVELELQLERAENEENWDLAETLNSRIEDLKLKT